MYLHLPLKEGEIETLYSLVTLQRSTITRAGLKLGPGHPVGGSEPYTLSHHLLPSSMFITRKLA